MVYSEGFLGKGPYWVVESGQVQAKCCDAFDAGSHYFTRIESTQGSGHRSQRISCIIAKIEPRILQCIADLRDRHPIALGILQYLTDCIGKSESTCIMALTDLSELLLEMLLILIRQHSHRRNDELLLFGNLHLGFIACVRG